MKRGLCESLCEVRSRFLHRQSAAQGAAEAPADREIKQASTWLDIGWVANGELRLRVVVKTLTPRSFVDSGAFSFLRLMVSFGSDLLRAQSASPFLG